MKIHELRNLIREEIKSALLEDTGAWRRIVIDTTKKAAIVADIEKMSKDTMFKSNYPDLKVKIMTPEAKPNNIVVDLDGKSASGLANKVRDIARKLDKSSKVVIRTERKLK